MNIAGLFDQIVLMFAMIIVGYIAGRGKIINDTVNKYLSTLVIFILTPMQILSSVINCTRILTNIQLILMTLLVIGIHVILMFVSRLIPKLFHAAPSQEGVYRYLFAFTNVGYFGYPIIEAAFGPQYRFFATIFNLTLQLYSYTYGIALISGKKMRFDAGMFKRPPLLASLAAYAIYFTGITFPDIVYQLTDTMGDASPVLSMLILGGSLAQIPLKQVFNKWQIYILGFLKLVILPFLIYKVLGIFIQDRTLLLVSTVLMSMPSATNITSLCYEYGGDEKLASSGVFVTTMMAIVTLPILCTILEKL